MQNVFKSDKKYLMIFGCHHKVGTSWFTKILTHIAREFDLKFQYSTQTGIKNDTDIFFDDHTRIDTSGLKDYRGVHLIRDPRDVIVSGYHYHKWTKEEWANEPKEHWGGLSYKEKINSFANEKEALLFEMNHIGKETIEEMTSWNYNNSNFFEVKYEDLLADQARILTKIFQHYNFNDTAVEKCVEISESYSFDKMKKAENSKHLRKGVAGDWKNYFDDELKSEFKKNFPDALIKLKYEESNDW